MTPADYLDLAAVFCATLPPETAAQFTQHEIARHLWTLARSLRSTGNIRRD